MIPAAGLITCAAYGMLAAISVRDAYPPLPVFFGCIGVAIACWLWAYRALRHPAPTDISWVFVFAIAFRCIGFAGAPLYEDDYFRYLWDAWMFRETGSPYGIVPAAFFGDANLSPRLQEILGGVNFPDYPTIYGPLCQWSFLLAGWIAPGAIWPLKLLYILVDLGIVALLWRSGATLQNVAMYAWCPLVIKEIAFTGHTDVLAAACLFAAWLGKRRGLSVWSAVALAAAIAAKASAVFLAPLLLWRSRPRDWLAAAAMLVVLYGPFVLQGATDLDGLRAFGQTWEFNSLGFVLLKGLMGDGAARMAGLALYGLICGYLALRRREWFRPDVLLGAFFLLSPVVNPWYLILLAPFVSLTPSATGIAALAAVFLSYATAGNLGANLGRPGPLFDHPPWVRFVEIAIVLLAGLWSFRSAAKSRAACS